MITQKLTLEIELESEYQVSSWHFIIMDVRSSSESFSSKREISCARWIWLNIKRFLRIIITWFFFQSLFQYNEIQELPHSFSDRSSHITSRASRGYSSKYEWDFKLNSISTVEHALLQFSNSSIFFLSSSSVERPSKKLWTW